jgi:hypothetical protein
VKVIRTMPEEGWTPVSNLAAQDLCLSDRALGLLVRLLSYPDGWETTIDKLAKLRRQAGGKGEGRDAMLRTMKELVAAGYAGYIRERGLRGTWTTEIAVCDDPNTLADILKNRQSANRCVGSPEGRSTGVPEDQSVTRNTDTNTYLKDEEKRSSNNTSSVSLAGSLNADAAASAAADEVQDLDHRRRALYDIVDATTDEGVREALLKLERQRPAVFHRCRNRAVNQLEDQDARALKSPQGVAAADRLSLKYAIHHYTEPRTDSEPRELSQWFTRLLDRAPRKRPPETEIAA